jgi:hypothetical protein
MAKLDSQSIGYYVYTLSAVRARLRRGAKAVQLFEPNTGRLINVTKKSSQEAL